MQMVKVEPHGELQDLVRYFWYAPSHSPDKAFAKYTILADGAPGIIFQHLRGHSSVYGPLGYPLPISFVYGQSTRPCINHILGKPLVMGLSFQPAAFKTLFFKDACQLTNTILDVRYIFPNPCTDRLIQVSNPQELIHQFSRRIVGRLRRSKFDKHIQQSIELVQQNPAGINPQALASRVNISRRHFQRQFKAYVGVCPEMYIRISKFQQSLSLLKNKQFDKLSDISYKLNYADQSHFSREFKAFSGHTPKAFLKLGLASGTFDGPMSTDPGPVRLLRL